MRCLIFIALVAFCQSSSPYSLGGYSGGSSIWRYPPNKEVGLSYPYQQLYGQDYPYQCGVGQKYYSPLIGRDLYQQYPYGVSGIWDVLGGRVQGSYNQDYPYQYGVGQISSEFYQQYPYGIWDILGGKYQGLYNKGYQQYPYVYGYGQGSPLVNYLQGYQGQYQKFPYYGIGQSSYFGNQWYQPQQEYVY